LLRPLGSTFGVKITPATKTRIDNAPSTFGAASSTPDSNSPFVGTGGPRKIQLGLKILF